MDLDFPSINLSDSIVPVNDDEGFTFPTAKTVIPRDNVTSTTESVQKNNQVKVRPGSFPHLGLRAELCAALNRKGYGFPTPIQRRVIPALLNGLDVVAMARTGSGKTAAFLAPLLHRLAAKPRSLSDSARRNGPRALILAPTRELALQTLRFHKSYGRELNPKIGATVVVGGTPLEAQFEALAICPDIVIATPGRLLQMLAEMGKTGGLTLNSVEIFVMDEADRLFEGTLASETSAIIEQLCPETQVESDRQTILVSATMPSALAAFTRCSLRRNVEVIRLDVDKTISPTLANAFLLTRSGDEKVASLIMVLRSILCSDEKKSAVVFAATHRTVEYLLMLLRIALTSGSSKHEESIICVHGNMDQGARVEAVAAFRKGLARVLIVTDVAARGIDLPELDVVVNFDMAPVPKLFVHRVGRVGRAGRPGIAVSLISAEEAPYMIDTLLFLGRNVSIATEEVSENMIFASGNDAWSQHSVAMDSTFIIGCLPKACIDDDTELLNKSLQGSSELEKLRVSARNANGLYVKTRARASGQSVRRAKALYMDDNGGSRNMPVHPWFRNLESDVDRKARNHVARLSSWRPKESGIRESKSLARKTENQRSKDTNTCLEKESDAEEDGQLILDSRSFDIVSGAGIASRKHSARQVIQEEQKSRFYVPLRRSDAALQSSNSLKARALRSRTDDDGLSAYLAVQAATMDVAADTNTDMLREKHAGRTNGMFWDRVSKKFVKGGVTGRISKQNVHVATREAMSVADGAKRPSAYGTEDGVMYKTWLNKNRKAIDRIRDGGNVGGRHDGLGNADLRKGAYGRRARIAAMNAKKHVAENEVAEGNPAKSSALGFRSMRSELKSVAEIKKQRKLKQKAEARRIAKRNGKSRQGSSAVLPRQEKRNLGVLKGSKVRFRK